MMNNNPSSLRKSIEESQTMERSPPEISPVRATVKINIAPVAIPFSVLKHVNLEQLIFEAFKSTFDRTSMNLPPSGPAVSTTDLLNHVIDTEKIAKFSGGYAAFSDDSIVSIQRMGFGSQTLFATVSGTTKQAEFICKKLLELLWNAVGRDRRWAELNEYVNLVGYETSSKVDLGINGKQLFSSKFQEFLANDIGGSDGFGVKMGDLGQSTRIESADLIVVSSCKMVQIEIGIFDSISGKHEACSIEFIPDTTFDYNRTIFKAQSELPYDQHVRMLEKLIEIHR